MEWKQGDWCLCEHKLQQIKEVADDGRVTGVSDGQFRMGSWDLRDRCFPLTLRNKNISDSFQYYHDKLHKETHHLNLNFPEFHRYTVDQWQKAINETDDDKCQQIIRSFGDWIDAVINTTTNSLEAIEVGGISLFRPRFRG